MAQSDTSIIMSGRPLQIDNPINVLSNAEAVKSQQMRNAMAKQEMDRMNSPEYKMEQERQSGVQKQKDAIEAIKTALPALTPQNWNQFGQFMQKHFGDAGAFGQPYDPAVHEKMMTNFGMSRVSDREKFEQQKAEEAGRNRRFDDLRGSQQLGYQSDLARIKAEQTAAGKSSGEDISSFQELSSRLPAVYAVTDKLKALGEKATYTATGKFYNAARRQAGMEPTEGAVARADYIATVDNEVLPLLRQTFGAAFTEKEGQSLKATLGDPDLSPDEKTAQLNAFIDAKVREVTMLAAKTGNRAPLSPVDQQALDWSNANQGDPRAAAILQKLGGNR